MFLGERCERRGVELRLFRLRCKCTITAGGLDFQLVPCTSIVVNVGCVGEISVPSLGKSGDVLI
jgi:hypothetical protein